jgi:hypothetical protein
MGQKGALFRPPSIVISTDRSKAKGAEKSAFAKGTSDRALRDDKSRSLRFGRDDGSLVEMTKIMGSMTEILRWESGRAERTSRISTKNWAGDALRALPTHRDEAAMHGAPGLGVFLER